VEVYGVTPEVNGNIDRLFRQFGADTNALRPHLYVRQGAEAVRHLFAVASGLDSMVLGETEITGQVKQAYQNAQAARLTGKYLNRIFQTALQTAKAVRTETQVGRGATSVGSVAVELAEKIFQGDLSNHSVLILGAGKMGEACVRHLAKKGVQAVSVANRSLEKAEALASEFGGRPVAFENRYSAMLEADIVVSSTGAAGTVVDYAELQQVMRARRGKPLFLVDIAVPRDIDPAVQKLENVYLYDIDDLEMLVRENMRVREQELALCQQMINSRVHALMERFEAAATPTFELPHRQRPAWGLQGAAACHG
jgi:glutamyl-tRNA reductase